MTVSLQYNVTFEIGMPSEIDDPERVNQWMNGAVDSAHEFAAALNEWISKQPIVESCKLKTQTTL